MKEKYFAIRMTPTVLQTDGHTFYVRPMAVAEAQRQADTKNRAAYCLACCLVNEYGDNVLTYEDAEQLIETLPFPIYAAIKKAIDDVTLTEKTREEIKKNWQR